jgi:general stress protein 26
MTGNAKVGEASANPRAEACVMMGERDLEGSVRLTGTLGMVHDTEVKKDVVNCTGFAESFWQGPGDPNYSLMEFKLVRLQYMRSRTVEILSVEIYSAVVVRFVWT